MAVDWALSGLNEDVLQNGFTQKARPNIIRSTMDAGIDKIRPRYRTPVIEMKFNMWITHAQYISLESFYNTDLEGGVNRFEFKDPANPTEMYEYRFLEPPSYSALGGLYYTVSFSWERLNTVPVAP